MDPTQTSPDSPEVVRARGGDRAALQELLSRNHRQLLLLTARLLGRRLRTRVSPSELLQSCYVDVVRGIPGLKVPTEEAFVAWTRRVIENGIRRKSREIEAQKRGFGREREMIPDALANEPTPSRHAMTAESIERLQRAISRLREDRREVLRLRVIEGLSHEQIADALGRPIGATRMLLSRARAELSLEIERMSGTEGPTHRSSQAHESIDRPETGAK